MAHAAAAAVKAGTDLECGYGKGQAYPALVQAVQQKLITEAELDTALTRLFRARFELGMFDPPSSYAYGRIPFSEVNSPEHRQLSLKAARESMVLLKNADHALPLKSGIASIAVVGPTAELVQSLQGNYNGPPPSPVSPLAGIEKRFASARIAYAQGSTLVEGFAMPIEHTALHPSQGLPATVKTLPYSRTPPISAELPLSRAPTAISTSTGTRSSPSKACSAITIPCAGAAPSRRQPKARISSVCASIICHVWKILEGFRLYLDGKLLVASNEKSTPERGAVTDEAVHFSDTQPHQIRLEYLHGTGSAGIDLTWQAPAAVLRDEAVKAARAVGCNYRGGRSFTFPRRRRDAGEAGGLQRRRSDQHRFAGGAATIAQGAGRTGKPLVVVVMQPGSAVAVNWAQEHALAVPRSAALWRSGWHGAIPETLAGLHESRRVPARRRSTLPSTNCRPYSTTRCGRMARTGILTASRSTVLAMA